MTTRWRALRCTEDATTGAGPRQRCVRVKSSSADASRPSAPRQTTGRHSRTAGGRTSHRRPSTRPRGRSWDRRVRAVPGLRAAQPRPRRRRAGAAIGRAAPRRTRGGWMPSTKRLPPPRGYVLCVSSILKALQWNGRLQDRSAAQGARGLPMGRAVDDLSTQVDGVWHDEGGSVGGGGGACRPSRGLHCNLSP